MSPLKKKAKKEEQPTNIPPKGAPTGLIRFVVDKVSELNSDGRDCPEVEVGGLLWTANVSREEDEEGDNLCIYLACLHNQLTPWIICVYHEHILLNADTNSNVIKKGSFNHRSLTAESRGEIHLNWSDVIDEKKGFIRDDKITIEIRFKILNMKGIRMTPRIDFTDPTEPSHDVILIIQGEKIYVNKGILSVHSPFFKAMFYGNFDEKDKKEIELKGIDRMEFIEMLHLIYCSFKRVTDDSAEYLLKLGDRFQIACVTEHAEKELIDSDTFDYMEKLRVADQYRLYGLLDQCLSKLHSTKDFDRIKKSPIYDILSDATKAALFEKILEKCKRSRH